MKKSYAFMFVVFFAVAFLAQSCLFGVGVVRGQVADSWVSCASMSVARTNLGVAVVGGKIYAIGGYGGSGPTLNTNEEYDPATDTWVLKAPMPTARMNFGVAVWDNKIYCIGGSGGISGSGGTRANEVYNPTSNTWETKTQLPVARECIRANAINGIIYVIGGESNETDVYDISTDTWSKKVSMPIIPHIYRGEWSCTSAVIDNKMHVLGLGYVLGLEGSFAFHQIYDPTTDSWSSGAEWPSGGCFGIAGATTGVMAPERIYFFGADSLFWPLGSPNFKNLVYSPENDSWNYGTIMPTPRINTATAIINDTIFVIGGETTLLGDNTASSATNEQYIPIEYGMIPPSPSSSPTIPEMNTLFIVLFFVLMSCVFIIGCKKECFTSNN